MRRNDFNKLKSLRRTSWVEILKGNTIREAWETQKNEIIKASLE